MSKFRKAKKAMFRDFLYKDSEIRKRNYCKDIRKIRRRVCAEKDLRIAEFEFLFWGYDLEFFTIEFASSNFEMPHKRVYDRVIYPLMKKGYVYKYFDRLTSNSSYEDHLFREETKFNYRVRYALSQKAVNSVTAWYREMNQST